MKDISLHRNDQTNPIKETNNMNIAKITKYEAKVQG